MVSPFERRRFSRFKIPLTVEYCTCAPDTGELLRGQGWLRDLSLCGTYMQVPPGAFQPGQIFHLTIATPLPPLYCRGLSRLEAKGEVVRFDPPAPGCPHGGVALKFLDNLVFAPEE